MQSVSRFRLHVALGCAALIAMGFAALGIQWLRPAFGAAFTVEQRLAEFGAQAQARLAPRYQAAGVDWPGKRAALLAFKDSDTLELYVQDDQDRWHFIHRYPILAASGVAGPKLREGDYQVPEGHYRVTFLNANSRFHVSLRLDYPNAFDRQMAAHDGRTRLGGDIMIHGSRVSVGCLAMGDPAAEELFTLAATLGIRKLDVLIAPSDLRTSALPKPSEPAWLAGLYRDLRTSLLQYSAE